MISVEANQSCDSPRSSMICSAPMASDRSAKPNQSNGRPGRFSVSATNAAMPAKARMPTGRLM
jgi:hypothetical protein